jgi:putative ABC transport system ATP-binding protein
MSSALVDLQDVTRVYRMGDTELRALDGVTLKVQAGETTAIMGASGSGKSTLMNLVGCLDRPTAGRYMLDGQEVSRLSNDELAAIRNRTIGFVFQSFNLLARTSALENVELPMLYSNVPAAQRHERARHALAQVGLEGRVDHHPSQMSGGQQQRVAIARALVNRPRILLADEPTGNLDSHTSDEVLALFQALGRSGITVILVTHEPDIATYADRVITMRDGKVRSDVQQTPRQAAPVALAVGEVTS